MSEKEWMDQLKSLIERKREKKIRLATFCGKGRKTISLNKINALLEFEGEEFIQAAYELLIERRPTTQEMEDFLSKLDTGKIGKKELLYRLEKLPEGRKLGVRIEGIGKLQRGLFSLMEIPLLGRSIRISLSLLYLPQKLALLQRRIRLIETQNKFTVEKVSNAEERIATLESFHGASHISEIFEAEVPDYLGSAREGAPLPSTLEKGNMTSQALYYTFFESVFYDHEKVRNKQKAYLPYLEGLQGSSSPFLDIGCGRGEFMEILRGAGISVKGIDINPVEISLLNERGFDAVEAEAIEFLKKSKDAFSGISALQVVEHLDYPTLHELLDLAYARLQRGGIIILETINPHNPFTIAGLFMDETHKRLIPPELLAFMLQWHGFQVRKICYTSPMPRAFRFNQAGRDYHDYALIGVKP